MLVRMLTSLVLVPVVLGALFWGQSQVLLAMLSLLVLGGTLEWCKLVPLRHHKLSALIISRFLAVVLVASVIWIGVGYIQPALIVVLVLWLLIIIAELSFPSSQRVWGQRWLIAMLGLVMLPLFFHLMVSLYQLPQGRDYLIYLLFLVWAADVGAYLSGRALGRHKLIPKVSPGKTWEGLAGGMLLSMAVAIVAMKHFSIVHHISWLILAAVVALISVVGDLFISMLKRRCQLKDTGAIFPGHGGVLDRIDSLLAALPWFYAGLTLTQ